MAVGRGCGCSEGRYLGVGGCHCGHDDGRIP